MVPKYLSFFTSVSRNPKLARLEGKIHEVSIISAMAEAEH